MVARWLARVGNDYAMNSPRPGSDATWFTAREWHALGGLRLRPGQGPVRVRVRIIVEREGRRC